MHNLSSLFRQRRREEQVQDLLRRTTAGLAAGFLAAFPMSIAMGLLQRLLPREQKYQLPPREITIALMARAGAEDVLDDPEDITLATSAAHMGYAAISGVAYATTARRIPLHPVLRGSIFGLALWAAGYLGWIPAVGLLSSATRHPRERTGLMIASHLIYGVTASLLTNLFLTGRRNR